MAVYLEAGEYMSPKMVAEYLGVSKTRVSGLLAEGRFPVIEIGAGKLIPAQAVYDLAERRREELQERLQRLPQQPAQRG